jgi:hypothetical protein
MSFLETLSDWGRSVRSPDALRAIEGLTDDKDVRRFVRLWMVEGIPYAFRDLPVVYELLREWVADRLDVHPMDVSLVGSGRLGFSTAHKKWLQPFSKGESDLDTFVVSERLFEALLEDFNQWIGDWEDGYLNDELRTREARLWQDNRETCLRTIRRGFLDETKIPARGGYKTVLKCRRVSESTPRLVVDEDGTQVFGHASIRVFKNWDAAVSQSTINLKWNLENAHN